MATLTIDSLDDGVYERLKDRARCNNRSVEAEVRDLLEAQVDDEERTKVVIARIAAFRERMKMKYGVQSDSVDLIRAIRDEE
jgi:plasmid stability protein